MAPREVVVTLIGAKDIKKGKLFGKQSPTAVVSVLGVQQKQVSRTAKNEGTEPTWNQQFTFFVEDSLLLGRNPGISLTIYSSEHIKTDNALGTAFIPLHSSLERVGEVQFGAYNLVRPSGRTQGFVNVSVKIGGGKFAADEIEAAKRANAAPQHSPQAHAGYPVHAQAYGANPQAGYGGYYPPQQAAYGGGYGAPPPAYYQPQPGYGGGYPPGYGGQPNVVYTQQHGGRYSRGGYGGGGGMGGGMGGMGAGLGAGLLVGGLGGMALGSAMDNDGGGCGGGGCGGGGCGGGCGG